MSTASVEVAANTGDEPIADAIESNQEVGSDESAAVTKSTSGDESADGAIESNQEVISDESAADTKSTNGNGSADDAVESNQGTHDAVGDESSGGIDIVVVAPDGGDDDSNSREPSAAEAFPSLAEFAPAQSQAVIIEKTYTAPVGAGSLKLSAHATPQKKKTPAPASLQAQSQAASSSTSDDNGDRHQHQHARHRSTASLSGATASVASSTGTALLSDAPGGDSSPSRSTRSPHRAPPLSQISTGSDAEGGLSAQEDQVGSLLPRQSSSFYDVTDEKGNPVVPMSGSSTRRSTSTAASDGTGGTKDHSFRIHTAVRFLSTIRLDTGPGAENSRSNDSATDDDSDAAELLRDAEADDTDRDSDTENENENGGETPRANGHTRYNRRLSSGLLAGGENAMANKIQLQMGKLKEAGPVRSGVEYALQKAFRTTDSQDVVDPAVELVNSRVVWLASQGTPFAVSSVSQFRGKRRKKPYPSDYFLKDMHDLRARSSKTGGKRAVSYFALLEEKSSSDVEYDPCILDDSEIRSGQHRTVVNLPGLMGSVIFYVKARELRKELNDQFREKHPWLNPTVTLSKMRAIKRNLLELALAQNLDICTVCYACVYFEKLCLQNLVDKPNRKLVAAVCLLLAYKFNEPLVLAKHKKRWSNFLSAIETTFLVDAKDLASAEFPVFAKLRFNLRVDTQMLLPHLDRLCRSKEIEPKEYLGADRYAQFFEAPHAAPEEEEEEVLVESGGVASAETSDGEGADVVDLRDFDREALHV